MKVRVGTKEGIVLKFNSPVSPLNTRVTFREKENSELLAQIREDVGVTRFAFGTAETVDSSWTHHAPRSSNSDLTSLTTLS